MSIAKTILQHLIVTEAYGRKVYPHLKSEYFSENTDRTLFDIIAEYVKRYSKFPSVQEIALELIENQTLSDIEFDEAKEFLSEVKPDLDLNLDWLVDKSENFCKDRAMVLAIQKAAGIISDEKNPMKREGIPDLLRDALAVSFTTSIGHDYLEDWEARYDMLHMEYPRVPFHFDILNRWTNNGLPPKSLTVVLATTGLGKSLLMCDLAAHQLMAGKNVLYISLELSKEMISQRIDANLMDIEMDLLDTVSKQTFADKIARMQKKTMGKLIVEEYATSSAGASHFRYLLNELKIKKNFVPDIIYIDYINLCISTRYKTLSNANSYTIVKMIAEELRGLAVDFNVPLFTATQLNRGGSTSTDPGLEDTAESWGLPQTADLMFAITQDEELKYLNQVQFKLLKNRFRDIGYYPKYNMGIQRAKMRFIELERSAQRTLNNAMDQKSNKKEKFIPAKEKDRLEIFNRKAN